MSTLDFGPERRKEGQMARFGRGDGGNIGIPGAKIIRRQKTPNELASWKLNQSLQKYPTFTQDARQEYQDEFLNMPNLRNMNMKVLAATLSFLQSNPNPTPETFKDSNILPHINLLISTKTMDENEKKRLIVRYKDMILIYVIAVDNYRKSQQIQ